MILRYFFFYLKKNPKTKDVGDPNAKGATKKTV